MMAVFPTPHDFRHRLPRLCRFLCLFILPFGLAAATAAATVHDVRQLGAAADGKTKDTAVIQKAIDAAAADAGGGEVFFPAGTYLTGSIELKSHVTLNLALGAAIMGSGETDDYPLVTARWEGVEHSVHAALVYAHDAEDIAITGSGSITGSGQVGNLRNPRGSVLIEPIRCKNVRLTGVRVSNDGDWTIHPTSCRDVTISHVIIDSVGHNSDGIDPDSCIHVIIDHCTISSGDDAIAIKSGKGQEGVKTGQPTDDVVITHCTILKGHGGVSIGSELSGGISRIKISDCSFRGVKEAIFLKTCPGRAGYVRDVQATRLTVTDVPLLGILTTYHANPDSQGVPGKEGLTTLTGIAISDVDVTSDKNFVQAEADPESLLDGLTLTNIRGSCKRGLVITNARNVVLKDLAITGLATPLLSTQNVQGTGLEGAVPYVAPHKQE